MNSLALRRALKIAFDDWKSDQSKPCFHYAFAIRKNKVLVWGKNNETSGSKSALRIGRMWNIEKWKNYPYIHAECDVISKLDLSNIDNDLIILSIRINRDGKFRLAKPCPNCEKALQMAKIEHVWWTDTDLLNENLILRCSGDNYYEFKRLRKTQKRFTQEAFDW